MHHDCTIIIIIATLTTIKSLTIHIVSDLIQKKSKEELLATTSSQVCYRPDTIEQIAR